jgi:hypothetical protein
LVKNENKNYYEAGKTKMRSPHIIVFGLLFLFCLAPCSWSFGATFYLATNGNDNNPGTSWDKAWATLNKCQSTLSSGDTVIIKNGFYGDFRNSSTGAYTAWITYKASPDQNAVRFGSVYLNHSSPGVNYYHRFEGIVFDKADYKGTPPVYYININHANFVYFKDCIIRGTGYRRNDDTTAVYINANDFTLDGCTIEGQDKSLDCGFQHGFRSADSSTNVTITGCDVRGCWRNLVDGYNWSITHNTIHDSYQDGIFVQGNNNGDGQQLLIAYNHIYNFFVNSEGDHTDLLQFGQTGSKIKNVIIRGNICHDTDHQAFWLNPPSGSGPCLVENNLVYNTWMAGGAGNDIHIASHLGDNGTLIIRNNIFNAGLMQTANGGVIDQLTGNIIKNLDIDWDGTAEGVPVVCNNENYNVIYRWGSHTTSHARGNHTVTLNSQSEFEALFNNYGQGDYTPAAGAVSVGIVPLNTAPSIDLNENVRADPTEAGCYISGTSPKTNHAPILAPIGNKSISQGRLLSFTVSATDPDGDVLAYSAQNLPSGATFANRTFNWTPDSNQVDRFEVTFVVSDGQASASETITITVTGTTNQPIADAGPDQTIIDSDNDGVEQVTLDGSGSTDPDGSITSYLWTVANGEPATGVRPTISLAVGQHTITLQVTDDSGFTDTDTVIITVEPPDVTAPAILSVSATETTVVILFNEDLDEPSATDTRNYGLAGGVTLDSVWLDSIHNRVILYTSAHQQGVSYTLTVVNVKDAAGNAMPTTTRGYIYTRGLAGHWSFDDVSGTSVTDISGHNNTGTMLNGAAVTAAGEASFAGGDDAVQIPTVGLSYRRGTVTLWAYSTSQQGRQYLFGHVMGSWSNRIQLYLDNGYLCLGMGNTHSLHTNIQLLDVQTWYHIALSWDGSNYVVYVDGVVKATGTYAGLTQLNTLADIANTGNTSSRNEGFTGLIDDVQVYSRALTAEEIADLALVFLPIGDKTVAEGSQLSFTIRTKPGVTVSLSDHNLPGTPTLASNVFTWTPNYNNAGNYQAEFTAPNGSATDFELIHVTVKDLQSLWAIGYWKFDETNGQTAGDSSTSNNVGYLKNGLEWGSGKINGAIILSVPNDAVEIRTTNFNANAGTIAMWVYVDKLTMSRHYLFGHAGEKLDNRIQLYLKYGYLCLGLGDSHETHKNIQQLQTHRWYHVALTWNWTGYRVYVDGSSKALGTYSGLTGFADHADIGNNGIYRDKALNGKIDDVRIYNRALSADEIAQLFVGN